MIRADAFVLEASVGTGVVVVVVVAVVAMIVSGQSIFVVVDDVVHSFIVLLIVLLQVIVLRGQARDCFVEELLELLARFFGHWLLERETGCVQHGPISSGEHKGEEFRELDLVRDNDTRGQTKLFVLVRRAQRKKQKARILKSKIN